jgi:hypothetical protein
LQEAEELIALCERFGCLPSALLAESTDLLDMLAIEARGRGGLIDGQ